MSFSSANTMDIHVSPARYARTLASIAEKSLTMNLYPGRGTKAVLNSFDKTEGTES